MRTYVMTATLAAAALTLSLALAAPALARSGDHAQKRKFHRTDGRQIHFCDTRSRQTADSGSSAFFDVGHTQTV
jgi:hypothetical protein